MDMIYLTSGSFWAVFGQFSAAIIAFGLAIAVARFVSKDVYGTYKYVLAIVSVVATLSLSGIGQAVFQSITRGFRRSLSDGFWANLRWSFLVFIITLTVGGYYLFQGNQTLGLGILLGGCITPFLSGFNLYTSLFSGEKDFRRAAWYGDVVTNIIPALTLIAVALIAPTALNLVIAYFLANLAAAAYSYWRGTRHYRSTADAAHDPDLLSYGKHLSLMAVLSGIAGNIDQLLLFHFGGAIDLAIYNFAIAIPDQAKGPLKQLDTMTQARFVNRTTHDIHTSLRNKMLWLTATSIITISVYVIVAPFIYQLFFPAYSIAAAYSQIYALSLFSMIISPAASYLSAKKRVRALYVNTFGSSILHIGLMVIGVVWFGLWGLIIARVFIRLGGALLSLGLYYRTTRLERKTI